MSDLQPLRVGLIGCGNISGAYLNHASDYSSMRIVACSDLNMEAAEAKAQEYGLESCGVDDLLGREDIDIVLNLTVPQAHAPVNMRALEAGKHAYCEKPFALSVAEAERALALASEKGLRLGCAPDTFLGGGHQACRKLIDEGAIGTPIAGLALMQTWGVESWHPNPDFYYLEGGGPAMDMGPYYVTALVNMLGPVAEVASMTRRSGERTCTSELHKGRKLKVEVETHLAGNLLFESGAIVTFIMSFDTAQSKHKFVEVHGTEGSLSVPDPNNFGGQVMLATRDSKEFEAVEVKHNYTENYRSLGLADMADGILKGRPHRASGALAAHVLEVLRGMHQAGGQSSAVKIMSRVERPAAMAEGLVTGELELV
ncbi:Gfo/Idh/MocA family protein [Mucisphaera calidilacus]|uniref:1,5-anhydro-D-fructose reductase n=1 Tax=Mucisphaera calidilacus TaxID=2527982 RepID=A0A518BZ42_9BACT|nr:Gfo/Idh/MocA family oxidoreductase [Mucisphaera calidilacus]QDU72239.1 1,5-anhydro-D-fructose reductase [Mucisphaera calidilacus]